MTKPTQRLDWTADALSGTAIRCAWYGSGWHYTLEWGDGTSERVLMGQPPVKHTYPSPGRYTIIARSGLHGSEHTATIDVAARAAPKPTAVFELVASTSRVRAELDRVDDHVVYLVDWGDGHVSQHDVHDLAPEHEYTPGFGKPLITVTDLPARRKAKFVGPEIPTPPPPEDEPRMQFRTTKGKPDWIGWMELYGFPPNTTVDLGGAGWRSYYGYPDGHGTLPGHVTTNASGYAAREYKLMDDEWLFDEWWQVHARWTDPTTQRWHQMFLPVTWCEYAGGPYDDPTDLGPCWKPFSSGTGRPRIPCNQFALLVDWEIAAPHVITLYTASPGPAGNWTIDWGDGSAVQTVHSSTGRLHVTRDYGALKNVWVTATRPDGRVAYRRLRQIEPRFETWKDGSLAIFYNYESHENTPDPCRRVDCDPYTVVRLDAGDGRPLQQRNRPSIFCPSRSGNGLSYGAAGEYRVAVHAPMSTTRYGTHVQKTRSIVGEFDIREDEPPLDPLSQTFHVDELHPTWYSAWFTIANSSDEPVPWVLEFTVDSPAVLAEISSWIGDATKHDLGDGRWRITCTEPVPTQDSVRLNITVDPCSAPRIWPDHIQVYPAEAEGET